VVDKGRAGQGGEWAASFPRSKKRHTQTLKKETHPKRGRKKTHAVLVQGTAASEYTSSSHPGRLARRGGRSKKGGKGKSQPANGPDSGGEMFKSKSFKILKGEERKWERKKRLAVHAQAGPPRPKNRSGALPGWVTKGYKGEKTKKKQHEYGVSCDQVGLR